MTMPTIFDVNAQPEEGDYFEPTDADYKGDLDDLCGNCGLVKESVLSPLCVACDNADTRIEFERMEREFAYGFNVLYYES
jgi:hypothetical protein